MRPRDVLYAVFTATAAAAVWALLWLLVMPAVA